jgi:hypothetical protein
LRFKWLGVILVIKRTGLAQPYLFPNVDVDFIFVTFFGELIFMRWLLTMSWRIKAPA